MQYCCMLITSIIIKARPKQPLGRTVLTHTGVYKPQTETKTRSQRTQAHIVWDRFIANLTCLPRLPKKRVEDPDLAE